jgi:CelD/BcsL family acetyltransferase involved in cellulose biosynthesis
MTPIGDRGIRDEGFTVTVARSVAEVEELRPKWERLQGNQLTTDLDWFLTTVEHDPRAQRPHVIYLERDGEPQGMVLGRLQDIELRCRLGYRKLYEPPLRVVTVVYGGFLGPLAEANPQALLGTLASSVRRGEVDALNLPSVRVGSPLADAVGGMSARARRSTTATRAHWYKAIPDSFDAFLGDLSSSTRQGVKRYANKLEREFADSLELRSVTSLDELEGFFADGAAVAAKTYQGGLGVGVRQDDELQRHLVRLGLERGWFRAYVLSLAGEPAAFWHGYAYRGTFRTMVPGYDPAYAKLNIGTYVLMKLIADLCDDPTIESLDYGLGDAEYKRRFGDGFWEEQDVAVFSPTLRALRIHAVRSVLNSGVGVGRSLIRDAGKVDRVKKAWRKRVADQA